jgi:hypothetical protein
MNAVDVGAWNANWAWSLPLIVLNVVIHVLGLGLINESVVRVLSDVIPHRRFMPTFATGMGAVVLLATALHGIEAATWATAYRLLGALPNAKSAILYSLSALTSYGHENLFLEEQWQLMGALEALNGMLLFGLTTAFLFAMIQKVWPLGSRGWHREARVRFPTVDSRKRELSVWFWNRKYDNLLLESVCTNPSPRKREEI